MEGPRVLIFFCFILFITLLVSSLAKTAGYTHNATDPASNAIILTKGLTTSYNILQRKNIKNIKSQSHWTNWGQKIKVETSSFSFAGWTYTDTKSTVSKSAIITERDVFKHFLTSCKSHPSVYLQGEAAWIPAFCTASDELLDLMICQKELPPLKAEQLLSSYLYCLEFILRRSSASNFDSFCADVFLVAASDTVVSSCQVKRVSIILRSKYVGVQWDAVYSIVFITFHHSFPVIFGSFSSPSSSSSSTSSCAAFFGEAESFEDLAWPWLGNPRETWETMLESDVT